MTMSEQIRTIIERYQTATGASVYQTHEVARWAIANRLWADDRLSIVDRCATAIARALREVVLVDGVRAKHAVRIVRGGLQMTLWADIRTAPRDHMALSFRQRREQIQADCRQLQTDLDYYNQKFNQGEPIQLSFDFSLDLMQAAD